VSRSTGRQQCPFSSSSISTLAWAVRSFGAIRLPREDGKANSSCMSFVQVAAIAPNLCAACGSQMLVDGSGVRCVRQLSLVRVNGRCPRPRLAVFRRHLSARQRRRGHDNGRRRSSFPRRADRASALDDFETIAIWRWRIIAPLFQTPGSLQVTRCDIAISGPRQSVEFIEPSGSSGLPAPRQYDHPFGFAQR
jgi:hypothetical protein